MIGGPVPQRVGSPVLRAVLLVGVPVGLVAALVLVLVPGPTPPGLYSQVVVAHDSMLPSRLDAPSPTEQPTPRLQSSLASQLGEHRIESWLYLFGRERVTVHRIQAHPEAPRNARALDLAGRDVALFELHDLSFLAWSEGEATLAVVGSCPVHDLKEVVAWVGENGPGPEVAPAGDEQGS